MSSLRNGQPKLGICWAIQVRVCELLIALFAVSACFSVKVGFVLEWIKHIDLVLTISESDPE